MSNSEQTITRIATSDIGDVLPFRPAEAPDEIGRIQGYSIKRLIGSGAMGQVYVAEDLALRRLVALKFMKPELAREPNVRLRFLREAQAVAAVTHDNIVRIYQVGEAEGVPFIAMEYLSGRALDSPDPTVLPPSEIIRIGIETASGLAAAHEAGLVHRDIKPANLWIEEATGRVKILDFGLARSPTDTTLTSTGQWVGSPAYMAPEQAAGRPVDGRADLFSLGCVLYGLAAGRRAFAGGSVLEVLNQLANCTPPGAASLNPLVPQGLSDCIDRLLAKNPANRPNSARHLVQELRSLGADPPVSLVRTKARRASSTPDEDKESLVTALRELRDCLNNHPTATVSGTVMHVLRILFLIGFGLILAVMVSQLIPNASSVLTACVLAICCTVPWISYRRWEIRSWNRRFQTLIEDLTQDHPEFVARLGGRHVLGDRVTLGPIIQAMILDEFVPKSSRSER